MEFITARDDEYALRGYLRIEAWPAPGWGKVRIEFDAQHSDAARVRSAVTEAQYDAGQRTWTHSPYRIEGYNPLAD